MKKFYLIYLLVVLSAANLLAQSKLSPAARLIFDQYKLEIRNQSPGLSNGSNPQPNSKPDTEIIGALVNIAPGHSATELSDLGYDVTFDLGNVVGIKLPMDKVEPLIELDFVKKVSFGEKADVNMNYARPSGSVDQVQTGFTYDGTTMSFDGKGVICGMMDTGLDANHVNFRNSDGSSRIQRLWNMNTSMEYTATTISRFTTENSGQSHATHVAGIIGGGYKGAGTYASMSSATGGAVSVTTNGGAIPFYGVATGADLAFAVGSLSYYNIIQGVTNIVNYAKSVGKPCVINMSLGSTSGPHDGTDAYSQALTELGKDAIICMSAGNDGDANMSLEQTFTSTTTQIKTSLTDNTANGVVDIWASDSTPLTVTWAVYNTTDLSTTNLFTINGADQTFDGANYTLFSSNFTGTLKASSYLDSNNNRFEVYNQVNITPKAGSVYNILLIVQGANGQKVNIYGDSRTTFARNNITGASTGSPANSINDAACAENILSVGAYTTRTSWPVLGTNNAGSGYTYTGSGFSVNTISPFSSYGKSFQGKQLPLVCAPGAAIISSYSTYYINAGNTTVASMSAEVTANSRLNYWGQMQGTSMSCPYVTGTIGLWLQADPTLDYDKVLDVINNTSTSDAQVVRAKARFGAGKINALEGAKYVLANKVALGTVWADDAQRLIITPTDGGYEIFVADTPQGFTATLVDLQGRPVARIQSTDSTATLSTSALSRGIYILSITTPQGLHLTHKLPL